MSEKCVPQFSEYIACSYEEEIIVQGLCYFSMYTQRIFTFPMKLLFSEDSI